MKKKILIFCFSDLAKDPRVKKQIYALRDKYHVISAGCTESNLENVEDHPILYSERKMNLMRKISFMKSLLLNSFESFYWNNEMIKAYKYLSQIDFDLVIANDLEALPICLRLAHQKNIKCVSDLHEYYPGQGGSNSYLYNKFNTYLCKKYLSLADEHLTVSDGIAQLYYENFGVKVNHIITNATAYYDLSPTTTNIERVEMVHHGVASRSRNLDSMIQLMDLVDNHFWLHFYLIGETSYLAELEVLAKGKNIVFHIPVSNDKLIDELNQYDIGLYLLDDTILNHKYCLPNKLFEYTQARLMMAITPNIEMAKYVSKYDLGVISTDFTIQSMANRLNGLSATDIKKYKENTDAASDVERDENNRKLIYKLVASLIDK